MEEKKKGKVGEITILIIVMIILGFVGGYFLRKEFDKNATSTSTCKTCMTSSNDFKEVYSKYKNLNFENNLSLVYGNYTAIITSSDSGYSDSLTISIDSNNSKTIKVVSNENIKSIASFTKAYDNVFNLAILTTKGNLYLAQTATDDLNPKFQKMNINKKIIDIAKYNRDLYLLTSEYKLYQLDTVYDKDNNASFKLGNLYENRDLEYGVESFWHKINVKTGLFTSNLYTYKNQKSFNVNYSFAQANSKNGDFNLYAVTKNNDIIILKLGDNNTNDYSFKKYNDKKVKNIKLSSDDSLVLIVTYKDGSTETFENVSELYNID